MSMREIVRMSIGADDTEEEKYRLREQLKGSERPLNRAYWRVYHFWREFGAWMVGENGGGEGSDQEKYVLVQKMGELHGGIVGVVDKVVAGGEVEDRILGEVERKIGDILRLRRMSMIQFAFCLDEFNVYVRSLGVLETVLQHRHW